MTEASTLPPSTRGGAVLLPKSVPIATTVPEAAGSRRGALLTDASSLTKDFLLRKQEGQLLVLSSRSQSATVVTGLLDRRLDFRAPAAPPPPYEVNRTCDILAEEW